MFKRYGVVGKVTASALDPVQQPAWLLRSDSYIEYSNRAAAAAMQHADWLTVRFGGLVAIGPVPLRPHLARRDQNQIAFDAVVDEGQRVRRVRFFLTAVPDESPLLLAWPQARWLLMATPAICEPVSDSWLAALAARYALTPTEIRVLQLLASGGEPRAIAESLGVSYGTVRSHLAALFEKTGYRRQAELARLAVASG